MTSIGKGAFNGCTGLTSITIPNSVINIGDYAFSGCTGLTSVIVEISTPVSINKNIFTNRANATLYVPFGSKAAYEAADYWKEFKEIVELDPVVTTDEALSADAVETMAGKTGTVGINLTNASTDLTAYQFDLTFPAGITLAVNDNGKYLVTKTDRYEDDSQSLSVSKLEGNTYRIVCFSLTNGKIEGTSGAILNAVLAVGNDVASGTYEAQITNCIITKADGTQLKLVDAKFDIVVNNVTLGDANGDNEVNVSDIVEVVNYILGNPSAGFVPAAADLNNDNEVNVTDIVMMVNIIMSGGNARAKDEAPLLTNSNDRLTLEGTSYRELSLCLENNGRYVASQFDLCLSEGLSVESITLNGNRSNGHELSFSEIGHNRYRVIVYSLDNSPYSGSHGELVNIRLMGGAGDIGVEDILFVTDGKSEKRFAPLHRSTTGIHALGIEAEREGELYNLKGQRVMQPREGIYIKDGKKVVIK